MKIDLLFRKCGTIFFSFSGHIQTAFALGCSSGKVWQRYDGGSGGVSGSFLLRYRFSFRRFKIKEMLLLL
jgi:hypothetical protein